MLSPSYLLATYSSTTRSSTCGTKVMRDHSSEVAVGFFLGVVVVMATSSCVRCSIVTLIVGKHEVRQSKHAEKQW